MATYVNDLRLKEIGTGESSGTWGSETNTNLELIAEAFSFGTEAITTNADNHTTTIADGSTDPGRSIYLKYTGALDSACTITIGPNTVSKLWFIENATTDSGSSGPYNIVISQGSGANVTIPNGHVKAIYSDGAGSGAAMVDAFTDLNLAGTTTVDDLTVSDDLTVTDDATIGGTLGVTGAVTANAGVSIDNITIDGTEIDLSSGDLSIDVAGNIQIDADDNGEIRILDGGTQYAQIKKDGNNALFQSIVADGDFIIQGIDGSSFVSALTLDMSDAGSAYFNNKIGVKQTSPANNVHIEIDAGGEGILVKGTGDHSGLLQFNTNRSNSNRVLGQLLGTWNGTDVADIQLKTADDTTNKDNGQITFSTSSADNLGEKMRLDDVGNLMIGTTTASPADGVSPAVLIGDSSDSSSGLVLSNSSHNWLLYNDSDGDFNIYDSDNNADRFTINSSGQHLQTPLGVSVPSFSFIGDTDTGMTRPTGDTLQFVTGGSEAVRINSSGRMFIGRTTALQSDNMLSVEGSGTGAGNAIMDIRNTASSDTCGCIALSKASTTTDSSARFIWFFANNFSTSMGAIGGNGANNVQFVTASDERLKENIKPLTGSLDKVLALNPVSYTWKESGEDIKAGFVAQEVEKILPEYTATEEDEMKTKSLTGGMTSGYIAVLTKAIQEQQEQIEFLKSEIKILKGE